MGWRMQTMIKTREASLEGKVHAIEDEVLLYQIEEAMDKVKEQLGELMLHCIMIKNFEREEQRKAALGAA